jgi:2,4-dienoyl-CoA reductase-like NADH-dependent reductase (Old Yellow Enzyme family)
MADESRQDRPLSGEPATAEDDASEERLATSRRRFISVLTLGSAGAAAGMGFALPAAAADAPCLRPASVDEIQGPSRASYRVFSPARIGSMRLNNRFVRSAAHETRARNEFVSDGMVNLHCGFAAGGVGLTLTGYMAVMEYGTLPVRNGAYDDRFLPGLTRLAKAVHEAESGAYIGAQIGHDGTGRPGLSPDGVQWPARIGPSGLDWRGNASGHAMTVGEIERFCADMGRAAHRLQQAGFDCVEIHGAHHYLIHSFLSPQTNRRTDAYGGSVENRVRIVRRVVEEIRHRTGPDFPILIKLNCEEQVAPANADIPETISIETFPELAKAIEAAGVDCIDISGSNLFGQGAPQPFRIKDQSYFAPHALAIEVDIPVILGCGNRHVDYLEHLITTHPDKIQFFCMARPLIREPDLVARWRAGRGSPRALCTDGTTCFPLHECAVLAAYREQFEEPDEARQAALDPAGAQMAMPV